MSATQENAATVLSTDELLELPRLRRLRRENKQLRMERDFLKRGDIYA